ncbi:MAG: hypothetical protein E6Q97_37880 [Desulfurellales bacterium]|nr:MAG: hypothetical protein E6Q97_37880 [Desulfurellales bacterium]
MKIETNVSVTFEGREEVDFLYTMATKTLERLCYANTIEGAALREKVNDFRQALEKSTRVGVLLLCALALPAAPLLSDGDETTSVGTVQTITPHPSWAAPIGGSSWISIAQTGWPLLTWLPSGTVVSFSEVFTLASMPSSATVSWAADDSASLWLNGSLVVAEAPMVGNGYSTCSDFAPTCRQHTSVDVLPWLLAGDNVIRFDVAQRGGWSFGLNYAVELTWLDDPPLPTPEPGTGLVVGVLVMVIFSGLYIPIIMYWKSATEKARQRVKSLRYTLEHISTHSLCMETRTVARKALEE